MSVQRDQNREKYKESILDDCYMLSQDAWIQRLIYSSDARPGFLNVLGTDVVFTELVVRVRKLLALSHNMATKMSLDIGANSQSVAEPLLVGSRRCAGHGPAGMSVSWEVI